MECFRGKTDDSRKQTNEKRTLVVDKGMQGSSDYADYADGSCSDQE